MNKEATRSYPIQPPEGVTASQFDDGEFSYLSWGQTVTPDQAEDWLTNNNHRNRAIKDTQVRKTSRLLSRDKFRVVPDAIHFASDGTLLNGQHRLSGIVATRISANLLILVGGDKRNQEATDDGTKRSAADAFSIEGRKYSSSLAAISKLVWSWQRNGAKLTTGGSHVPSNEEITELVQRYPALEDSAEFVNHNRGNPNILPLRIAGAFHFLVSSGPLAAKAEEFLEAVESGTELAPGHPALTLRNRIMAEKFKPTTKGIPVATLGYWMTHAWNTYVDDKKLSKLQAPRSDKPLKIKGCKFPQVD